ncbi:hypothetical protein [Winogradskyella psychrotolerans]|uniref:hypothetical protein n=1 Tax=Winogradskyella psychrotolerans TaxID=1344585 RepID=UPI001C0739C7|nr:hypothetical protein [Winogradskyella psychrotolerans]MBU2927947.1 hypothetical protein [Winogradskyella psychrotolerans]
MKTILFKSKLIRLFIAFLIFASCSKDDESSTVDIPTVNYTATNFDATFFQTGNSTAPIIDWNGDQGTFSLSAPLAGLNIDSINGILSWDKTLPIGIHNLQVIITNSAGQTVKNITLSNPLQGVFTGFIINGNSEYLEMEFFSDGTIIVKLEDSGSPPTAYGTWTKNNTTIIANLTNPENGVQASFSGTLTIDTTAKYTGNLYSNPNLTDPLGVFEVVLH